MASNDDGGPAFPQPIVRPSGNIHGMSLRDYFAGQALEGRGYDGWRAQDIAEMAYEIADTMLRARSKGEG